MEGLSVIAIHSRRHQLLPVLVSLPSTPPRSVSVSLPSRFPGLPSQRGQNSKLLRTRGVNGKDVRRRDLLMDIARRDEGEEEMEV